MLKLEVSRFCEFRIISKINEPTDRINKIVIVKKSIGSVRICLNPKDLNNAIKNEYINAKS